MADEHTGNYHVSIWEAPASGGEPPSYVCQLCVPTEAARLTLDEVQAHIREVHGVEPVASPSVDAILALQAQDTASATPVPETPAATATEPSTTPAEEPAADARPNV